MSVVTYSRDLACCDDVNEGRAQGPGFFLRLVAALQHSRELQAAREIERHRHLIDAGRNMAESTWTR